MAQRAGSEELPEREVLAEEPVEASAVLETAALDQILA